MHSRSIYTVAAKSEGEVHAHCITRTEFLRHVIADSRTRDLFEFWGEHFGIDPLVERCVDGLELAAHNAGMAHRSLLRDDEGRRLTLPTIAVLAEHEASYERRLAETRPAREKLLLEWIVFDLFGAKAPVEIPVRAWLASDLLTIFDVEVSAHVWGESHRGYLSHPPTLAPVLKGQRPKGEGEHLRRNATWFYRVRVADPKATIDEIAEEYRAVSSVPLEPKRKGKLRHPADTKLVRHGIAEAERLLKLTIPPELWSQHTQIH